MFFDEAFFCLFYNDEAENKLIYLWGCS